ncbi:50S ribosomal protein L11 methyltransferase [Rhodovulum sulfidophilum]|uniref:50S ribosomal protein L11 methyltransferase n=1 Tax=Rhodovulum sulfidophilum TaxID=35806 RepID=UPI00138968A0|nr:50S ribosomal protein L11 methyltransferase [Rhodovulum sulfidophilum]NDK37006.1 class I SAM-dependent methyltransferase [Rhodovulum sulfidophilum]
MFASNHTFAGTSVNLNTARFFNLSNTTRIREVAKIELSDRSYLPKVGDPRSDWVASVAVPAFQALAQAGVEAPNFCSIGTGAGLDALAAIEILNARNVFVTDLHDDVVTLAHENIVNNVANGSEVTVAAGVGDLLSPIIGKNLDLDLLYENLPNIPMSENENLYDGQTSSTFIKQRGEQIPDFIRRYLVELHYVALRQAFPLLKSGGRALSSIGGRIPLDVIVQIGRNLGYRSQILTFTWKIQSEPAEVIGGYAQWEKQGFGPFRFYPAEVLAETFSAVADVASGARVRQIELSLFSHEMSATSALAAMSAGVSVGHTVAILESLKP